jgi:hypothetical protein
MLASEKMHVVENIGRNIAKHSWFDERAMKKEFYEAWSTKPYVEVNEVLHVTIRVNVLLLPYIYRTPICNSTLAICKTCMQQLRKEELRKKVKMFHTWCMHKWVDQFGCHVS